MAFVAYRRGWNLSQKFPFCDGTKKSGAKPNQKSGISRRQL